MLRSISDSINHMLVKNIVGVSLEISKESLHSVVSLEKALKEQMVKKFLNKYSDSKRSAKIEEMKKNILDVIEKNHYINNIDEWSYPEFLKDETKQLRRVNKNLPVICTYQKLIKDMGYSSEVRVHTGSEVVGGWRQWIGIHISKPADNVKTV